MSNAGTDVAAFRAARDLLLTHREDYETAYREFRWPVLHEFNWARDWFDGVLAVEHATQTALWIVEEGGTETRLTFAELSTRSSRVAGWLRSHGVRRGDHILLMLGNQVELWEVALAAMKLGAVLIPSSTLLATDDITDRVQRGRVVHVVARDVDTPKFDGVAGDWTRIAVGAAPAGWLDFADAYTRPADSGPYEPTAPTDPLLLYFTSGTTASPKLVEHTYASYTVGHLSTMYWLGLRPGDVHINVSSPGWGKHAWSSLFAPWNAGATVLVVNYARFSAATLLDAAVRCGATTMCAPPTVWRMLIQADLTRWQAPFRECMAAGEPLNPEIIERVRVAWGVTVRDGYGQTETTATVGNTPGQELRPGSMGRPLPGYKLTVVDSDGVVGADEGELCLELAESPLGLMAGYRDDAERTAWAVRDGLYHTCDLVSQDADGYITYVARTDDVFKASDYRISPFELESVLLEHEAVVEAAVVPSPDPLRLFVPKAYVVLAAGWSATAETALAILRYARQRLAPYKRIRRIEFGSLPKTISGKIRRVELRGSEDNRAGARTELEFWEDDFPDLKVGSRS